MPELNNAQLEILKLFKHERSGEELFEIKKILSDYLFKKAIKPADEAFEEKGYTVEDIEAWKNGYMGLSNANFVNFI